MYNFLFQNTLKRPEFIKKDRTGIPCLSFPSRNCVWLRVRIASARVLNTEAENSQRRRAAYSLNSICSLPWAACVWRRNFPLYVNPKNVTFALGLTGVAKNLAVGGPLAHSESNNSFRRRRTLWTRRERTWMKSPRRRPWRDWVSEHRFCPYAKVQVCAGRSPSHSHSTAAADGPPSNRGQLLGWKLCSNRSSSSVII